MRPIAFKVITLIIMTTSAIWYNFILQFYYIVHLKSVRPSTATHDAYFPAVTIISSVLTELNFCLLVAICIIMHRFLTRRSNRITKAKLRRMSPHSSS